MGVCPTLAPCQSAQDERGAVTLDLCERRGVIEAPGYPAHGLSDLIEKDGVAQDELRL